MGEEFGCVVYLVLLLVVVGGYLVVELWMCFGKLMCFVFVWVMIFLGVIVIVGMWGDICNIILL